MDDRMLETGEASRASRRVIVASFVLVLTTITQGLVLGVGLAGSLRFGASSGRSAARGDVLGALPFVTAIVLTCVVGALAFRAQRVHTHARATAVYATTLLPWSFTALVWASLARLWLMRTETFRFTSVRGLHADDTGGVFADVVVTPVKAMVWFIETV